MKLKIKDGRGELYQWDTGRKLIIEDGANIDYLHFADFSKDDGVSYQSEVIEENGIRCCRIPNACFANESTKLVVYAVEADDDGMATTTTVVFPIRKRQKPSDYTASPEIIISAEEILRKASAKADEAESYMNTSMQYAINPVDEVISGTDKYSSLHWASKANDIYNDVVEYVGSPSDPSSALGSIDTAKQSAITDIDAHVDTVKIDLTSYVENAESYASQALSYSTSASTSESNAKAAAEAAAAAESNSLSYKDLAETAKSNAQNARDEAVSAKNIAIETIVAIQGIESNVSSMKSSVDASEANVTTMQSDVSTMKASVETLKSETQTIVDNAENDVKGLLSTKADKTELAVERARIDSLSRLSEGSTTGDAELIDLRIGADGVTYGNAGTAVRTQISDLKGDLDEVDDRLTLLDGGTPPKWEIGNVGITTSGWNYDITASTKRIRTPKGKEIFLKAGTKIGLKTYNGYRYYVGIRKTDGSYIVNNGSSTAWQVADLTLTSDGYVVVMISANPESEVTDVSVLSDLFFVENFDGTKSFVEEVRENIGEISRKDIKTTFTNAYISDIGIITTHDGYRVSDIVELKCGETLYLKARGEKVVSSIYRYNKDGSKRIKSIAKFTQTGVDEFRYTSSEKVEYVRFCYNNSFERDYGIYSVSNNMIDGIARRNTTTNDFYRVMFDKVLCIGDSITQGFYGDAYGFPTGKDYPSFLSKMTGWECTNAGHSGYTTKQYWEGNFLATYDLTTYDAVIVFLGTNGGFTDTLDIDTASTPYADTNTGDYCKIIEYIKEQNENIKIFMIVPPVFNELNNYPYGKKVLIEISEKYDLPLLDLSIEVNHFIANRDNGIVHPNNDYVHYGKIGYLQIADNIRSGMVDYIADNPLKFELPY